MDQELLQRTALTLVNADRNMSLLVSKLRGLQANELASIEAVKKNLNVELDNVKNKRAKKLIQELQEVDIFSFSQDLVELIQQVESAQDQLIYYIHEMKKVVNGD